METVRIRMKYKSDAHTILPNLIWDVRRFNTGYYATKTELFESLLEYFVIVSGRPVLLNTIGRRIAIIPVDMFTFDLVAV